MKKKILGGNTETDAQPPSQHSSKASSSTSSKVPSSEKYWEKVEKNRKLFIIFLMDTFEEKCKWVETNQTVNKRDGAVHDAARLTKSMTRLGFEVRIYRNQPKQNVGDLLEKLGKLDMTHIDVFGMAISSHGSSNNIIYLSDAPTDLNFFVDPIKSNKTLAQKPKLFFVNACRGGKFGKTVELVAQSTVQPRMWPYDADCLIHFSSIEKTFSLRNTKTGSYFIVALCDVLDSLKAGENRDIHEILATVNRKVASLDPVCMSEENPNVLQIPVIQSTLTNFVVLSPENY
ncbi:unnamed protein product [Oikopleura dioica]|uniref:Caspase family p20 domain-containing protein n=1 Tax=Oikopleura dioica TaxID=34765 RepID=E4XA23_OIKDI|nr:unnamed protein product [Oikopleura dioica]